MDDAGALKQRWHDVAEDPRHYNRIEVMLRLNDDGDLVWDLSDDEED